jgi:parvin
MSLVSLIARVLFVSNLIKFKFNKNGNDPKFIEENEERSALEINERKKLDPLIKVLIEWINNELSESRIIIKDLQEDIYDGQILQMLIEKLSGLQLTTSKKLNLGEISRKQNLKNILDFINTTMDIHPLMAKWKVETIYDKDLIAILHLLVSIVNFFEVQVNLPENIIVNVIVIQVFFIN